MDEKLEKLFSMGLVEGYLRDALSVIKEADLKEDIPQITQTIDVLATVLAQKLVELAIKHKQEELLVLAESLPDEEGDLVEVDFVNKIILKEDE